MQGSHIVMMLASPSLRVVPLTRHIALTQVPLSLHPDLVAEGIVVTVTSLRSDFGSRTSTIALVPLTPMQEKVVNGR